MRNLFGMIAACLMFMAFGQASATSLPPVPTSIVNAPKAQFIGSMVTANNDASGGRVIRQAVTPLNPQFKDCTACMNWLNSVTISAESGLVAKFVGGNSSAPMATSWAITGYVGYIGACIDSQSGNSCSVPE